MNQLSDKDARQYAMFCHLASLCAYIGVPLGNIIGPLIVWQIKKNESSFVDQHGKESLNFQISMLIWMAISGLLWFVVIGIPITIALGIAHIVLTILAAVAANDGRTYEYPLTIRFIK